MLVYMSDQAGSDVLTTLFELKLLPSLHQQQIVTFGRNLL